MSIHPEESQNKKRTIEITFLKEKFWMNEFTKLFLFFSFRWNAPNEFNINILFRCDDVHPRNKVGLNLHIYDINAVLLFIMGLYGSNDAVTQVTWTL